jgi:hypothetical protein
MWVSAGVVVHSVQIDFSEDALQHRGHAEGLLRLHLGDRFLQQQMIGMEHGIGRDEHRLTGEDVRGEDLPPCVVGDDDLVLIQLFLLLRGEGVRLR